MWEIFSNTCLCQHLLKSNMSDAVKDSTQNALITVPIPPVVLNLSLKPKSLNKTLHSRGYCPSSVNYPKEGRSYLFIKSSLLVVLESWVSKPQVWCKFLGYGPLFSKHGRTNIDSITLGDYKKMIASWGEEQKAAYQIFCIRKSSCKSQLSE